MPFARFATLILTVIIAAGATIWLLWTLPGGLGWALVPVLLGASLVVRWFWRNGGTDDRP